MTRTMGSPKLRELTRVQLQSLAKREFVRAVGKTENIIRRLMQKHPKGVPVPDDGENPSASSAPPRRSLLRKTRKDTPSRTTEPATSQNRADPKGKGKAKATSPSPSSSSEALELLYPADEDEPVAGPSSALPKSIPFSGKLSPAPPSERPPHGTHHVSKDTRTAAPPPEDTAPVWRAEGDEDEQEDDGYDEDAYLIGAPNLWMVKDALRQFTTLTDTIPTMEARMAEHRCLLRRTKNLLEKATPDARELTVTREYLETFVLARMKAKRELWDGTGKMDKQNRKIRMEWLRAERKVEGEKKWRTENEEHKKRNLEPVPLSAFLFESDEESIESLRTTPTSSRNGSAKRGREEGVDVESDAADFGVGPSQRKRTRF